ncbi:RNA helicase [Coprinopsis cinerea okayama7|uniref:RNA helicase n=1 Tax=Coprinopsis cinerea (strain Okayama-7 / 130 / ATCC MYA-4618 / FGSC 9003) TaxID=240176 RepID=A8P5L5_COPC7|nr:RNA helicase [Coprinopsis cinerea okayama7\|eukprot:XP_001838971.2 RNA helicase [Coprinopsis cinerea okayama7\
MEGRNQILRCPLCEVNVVGPSWDEHLGGTKHRKQAVKNGVPIDVEPITAISTETSTVCDVCKAQVPNHLWSRHVQSPRHKSREKFLQYRAALDEAEKDKNGLVVDAAKDLGYVDPAAAGGGLSFKIDIKSTLPFGKSVLLQANLASKLGSRPTVSGFSVASATFNTAITPRTPCQVYIRFVQRFIGRYDDRLELVFEDTQLKKKFIVSRPLKIVIGSKAEHQALQPVKPYTPRPRTRREPAQNVVEGVPPPSSHSIPYIVRLPRAVIPTNLLTVLDGGEPLRKQIEHVRRIFFPREFCSATYARHFKNLIWIEEHKSESDLERYDMRDATLQKHNRYYYLAIPGLAEKRPSVLVGDKILVQRTNAPPGHWFEGHVHVVRKEEVALVFHTSFAGWSATQRYNIRFKLNRIVVRRQHQALDSAFEEDRVLFPRSNHVKALPPMRNLQHYNHLISTNEPQVRAVVSIARLPAGSPPFIVFGPPGTGKTITIVEAIRQVLKLNPNAKILACAPSNSAADLIAERLAVGLNSDMLFRMYAPSRTKDQVPDKLCNYVFTTPDNHFSVPPIKTMMSFRVIVSTCVAASMASGIGIPRGHFSHIFIDEAGQATEPEAFISIKTMADSLTNIVLSGDPKQLGPIIRSPIARTLGLETSYLERLMNLETYDEHGLEYGSPVVKLIKNFRSHESILKFPNEKFYSGDLQPCANPATINAYLKSSFLPKNPKFPVVFHSVSGKDDREASSPSFFNVDEVLTVKDYVRRLKENRSVRISDNEIGIITPYHAQCLKIRASLRSVADGIKVGSVEEFQGQERKVIIISTVRSSKEFVDYDVRHTLGFVASPRRFNVAVTRAQALLIVVGNPQVLGLDPLWRSFLNYVYLNDGWTGSIDIPWDPSDDSDDDDDGDDGHPTLRGHASTKKGGYSAERVRREAEMDMNAFTRRMEELALGNAEDGGLEDDANVDRPWRDVE